MKILGSALLSQSQCLCSVVAETIAEFICLSLKSVFNGNSLEFKREFLSVIREFLLTFPQICLCNDNSCFWQHDFVSVIAILSPHVACSPVTFVNFLVLNCLVGRGIEKVALFLVKFEGSPFPKKPSIVMWRASFKARNPEKKKQKSDSKVTQK